MVYWLKIAAYILSALAVYAVCARFLPVKCRLEWSFDSIRREFLGFGAVLFSSALFGWYSTICSAQPYAMDRNHYAYYFTGKYYSIWTPGLREVANALRPLTDDPTPLFFTVTFLCVSITLWAYRLSEDSHKEVLLFWSFGMSIINSFYLLKQAPAISFGALSIVLLLKGRYIPCAAALAMAVAFHETALILVPLFFALLLTRWNWSRWAAYGLVTICVLFFAPVSRLILNTAEMFLPSFFEQAKIYLDETGALAFSLNLMTAIKGFPYYLITAYGFWSRSKLKDEICHYDKYLMISVCASAFYLLSAYMYWLWRVGTYCFFPMYLFASELYHKTEDRRLARAFFWTLLSSLAFFTLRYLYQVYFIHGGF